MIAPTFVLDGRPLVPQPRTVVVDGRTFLPVRALAQAVGGRVSFDPRTGTIVVQRDARRASLRLGAGAILVDGRTYAPLRAVADALGVGITYDATARRIALDDTNLIVARTAPPIQVTYAQATPSATPLAAPTAAPPLAPRPFYSAEAVVTANPNAPVAAPAYAYYLLADGERLYGLRNAFIARTPSAGERRLDVVVHGTPQGWGFVTLAPNVGAQTPLAFEGGDRFVAHVQVPPGVNAPRVYAFVHFYLADGTPLTYRIPTAFALDTATPAPLATPTPPTHQRQLQKATPAATTTPAARRAPT